MGKVKDADYRSIFISDTHLGTKGCKANLLHKFLKSHTSENLYLVGDIVDGWRLRKKFRWPDSHNEIMRTLLKKSHKGTNVIYITGNHDEFLRKWVRYGLQFGNVKILNRDDYVTVSGKNFLVVHGDMFDNLMKAELKWIMHLGDALYNFLIWLNTSLNKTRRLLGMKYWSVSKFLKKKTKKAVNYINGFEEKLADYAAANDYDGVICGHIHSANIKDIDGITYINCGDWVESCTAIVETHDGEFKLIDWDEHINHN
jgi:UDP-2,3-diacylglucosamine pyrophosphatase LpxH